VTRKKKPSRAATLKKTLTVHLEQLAGLTTEARIAEEMQHYLSFTARFHRYSFNNVLAIRAQRPAARLVAGYRKWQELGFQVLRGEKGIGILAPMPYRRKVQDADGRPVLDESGEPRVERGVWFKVVNVFDVSQVGIPCTVCGVMNANDAAECQECGYELDVTLPQPPEWITEGEDGAGLATGLETYAQSLGVEVAEGELPGEAQGNSSIGRVTLREGQSPLGRAATLVHELAHETMHDLWARLELPAAVREVEAEAVAYVVLSHYGFEHPGAVDYVALHDRDGSILTARFDRIAATASELIEGLETLEVVA
jgi:antirestriction protein ArdC